MTTNDRNRPGSGPQEEPRLDGVADDFGLSPRPKVRPRLVDPLLGTDLGGVKIVKLIGEGGMGRVYEARQERPDRTVAVKVIRQGITSEKTLRRFEREAEFLAKLQHPGIAQIYIVGSYSSDYGDVPFYVMEFIADAKPITNYCFEKQLPVPERLRLFAEVCDAVAHGHDRGIIHRDLKPGNILIDCHGKPRVIDFGVARSTDSDLTLTSMRTDSGHLVGTAQYMSPEQFGPKPDNLDSRADVYSLGVVLYEVLAGSLPYDFARKGLHEIARLVCEESPKPLRSRVQEIPRDVSLIVRRCLEKSRGDRYHSAGELAVDIRRHLAGQPVLARGAGLAGRRVLRRIVPRGRAGRAVGLVAVAALLAGAVAFVGRAVATMASRTRQLSVSGEPVADKPVPDKPVTEKPVPVPQPKEPASPPGVSAAVCEVLAAKKTIEGLAGGVIPFMPPKGNGRSGSRGIALPAPDGWKVAGSRWAFGYTARETAQGFQVVHPFKQGHVVVTLTRRRKNVTVVPGGSWKTIGWDGGRGLQVTREAEFEEAVVRREWEIDSHVESILAADGRYELRLDGRRMLGAEVTDASPFRFMEGFERGDLPEELPAGFAMLLIGPTDGADENRIRHACIDAPR